MKIATIDLGKEPLFLAPVEDVTDARSVTYANTGQI